MWARKMMEQNRDTAGWGIIGTVWAMASMTELQDKLVTAALVAGCGWLASYVVKKLVLTIEVMWNRWWRQRKAQIITNIKRIYEKVKTRIGRVIPARFKRGGGSPGASTGAPSDGPGQT